MSVFAQTPDFAFRNSQGWVLGNVSQWQHWPLAPDSLAALQTTAAQWQAQFPEALIIGGISYEQAALHHDFAYQAASGSPLVVMPGAFLGLVLPEQWQHASELPAPTVTTQLRHAFTPHLTRTQFTQQLDTLIAQLRQAPEQQANLTQLFSATFEQQEIDLWQAWLALMAQHPAPHACYVNTNELALLSASPELMLKANPQQLQAEPIKGSRPRGRTAEEDEALRQHLLNSTKDRAENRMIAALQAKELAPLCMPNSVAITQACELRRYSNVQHLVSTVVGTPKAEISPLAALIACMPGASITGTPKAWAMKAIAELEAEPRAFYCGSFFHLQGNELVANVLIRTVQAVGNQLLCHGGGGITALSNSAEEYEESCFKVAPLFGVWER